MPITSNRFGQDRNVRSIETSAGSLQVMVSDRGNEGCSAHVIVKGPSCQTACPSAQTGLGKRFRLLYRPCRPQVREGLRCHTLGTIRFGRSHLRMVLLRRKHRAVSALCSLAVCERRAAHALDPTTGWLQVTATPYATAYCTRQHGQGTYHGSSALQLLRNMPGSGCPVCSSSVVGCTCIWSCTDLRGETVTVSSSNLWLCMQSTCYEES